MQIATINLDYNFKSNPKDIIECLELIAASLKHFSGSQMKYVWN